MNNFSDRTWLFILLGSVILQGLLKRPKAWFDFYYFPLVLFMKNFNFKQTGLYKSSSNGD